MIATVICFCSLEMRFIERCVEEARHFSGAIVIAVCDHLFDGTPERRAVLQRVYEAFPDCQFVEFAWDVKRIYTPFLSLPDDEEMKIRLWHATGRYVGAHFVPPEAEYVLFVDADEIADGRRLAAWLESGVHQQYDALWFSSYTYRFFATEQRKERQYAALMVRQAGLVRDAILNANERYGHLSSIEGAHWIQDLEERPFFHHYSWVRPPQECLAKALAGSKRGHCDWAEKLGGEFFTGEFESVAPFFDPLRAKRLKKRGEANVVKVNRDKIFRMNLAGMVDGVG